MIRSSRSDFTAPIMFVGKKDGTRSMSVDYYELNKQTEMIKYPLLHTDDILDQLCSECSKNRSTQRAPPGPSTPVGRAQNCVCVILWHL